MDKKSAKRRRWSLMRLYAHRYERHYSSRPGCFYCGEPHSTIDHCPPITFCEVKDEKWFKEKNIRFYIVACCSECNTKLSNKPFLTLHERAGHILSWLEKKSNEVVIWTEDEINEMSSVFAKSIIARKKQHQMLIDRVRFCQELLYRRDDFPEEVE